MAAEHLNREVELGSDEDSVLGGGGNAADQRGLLLRLKRSHLGILWAGSLAATAVATRWASAPPLQPPGSAGSQDPSLVDGVIEEWAWGGEPSFWPDFWHFFDDAKYIDLTHSFQPKSPVWDGFGSSAFSAGKAGKDIAGFATEGEAWTYERHGFMTTDFDLSTDQLGTQLDPPAHWNEYGATISDIPATYALRPLVVIDLSSKVADDAGYELTIDDILHWESEYGTVPEGSVVFVRTDWSKDWTAYQDGTAPMPADFPGVGLEALKLLHKERHILFHGHEPLDTDQTPTLEGEAWLMHNHFAQAEGLTNLDQVQAHGCLVAMGWAKLEGGTGGYARFVAICPDIAGVGGVKLEEPGAALHQQVFPLRRNSDGVLVPTEGVPDTEYCLGPSSLGCLDGIPTWDALPER